MPNTRKPFLVIVAVAVSLFAASCGRVSPTSPDTGLAPASATVPEDANASARVATSSALQLPELGGAVSKIVRTPLIVSTTSRLGLPGILNFVIATVDQVLPGVETSVSSGPWQLQFHPGSLDAPKPISVARAADGSMVVQFGPDGTQFGTAVDVTIDYTGTALDPSSPRYIHGLVPQFLYYNPSLKAYVEMPCTVDAANRKVHAKLQHFSQYALGGKAGW